MAAQVRPGTKLMSKNNQHASRAGISKRLKRAAGHMQPLAAMIEANRSCLDIAQQLHAVEKAVAAATKALIHDHIDHCLADPVTISRNAARGGILDFREITKYL